MLVCCQARGWLWLGSRRVGSSACRQVVPQLVHGAALPACGGHLPRDLQPKPLRPSCLALNQFWPLNFLSTYARSTARQASKNSSCS